MAYKVNYFSVPELSESLQKNGFKVEMYGAFSVLPKSAKEKIVAFIREIAVALHFIPKTMKGKEFLKKAFYGKLKPLKGEIEEGSSGYFPPRCSRSMSQTRSTKVIYAVAKI